MSFIQLLFPGLGIVSLDVQPSADNCGVSILRYMTVRPEEAIVTKETMYREFYSFITKGELTPAGVKSGYQLPLKNDDGPTSYFWVQRWASKVKDSWSNSKALFLLTGAVRKYEMLPQSAIYDTIPFCLYNKLPMFPLAGCPAHAGDRRTAVFGLVVEYTTDKIINWSK